MNYFATATLGSVDDRVAKPNVRNMDILIAGLARSGTTALFFKLKQAAPEISRCLYEPSRLDQPRLSGAPSVLAKIVIDDPDRLDYASFRDFNKKILITRDPRDNLLSHVLYRPCIPEFRYDDSKLAMFTDALRLKEANPGSISVLGLVHLFNRLVGQDWLSRFTRLTKTALDFHDEDDDFFVYCYEDFVAGQYEALEKYLGRKIPDGETSVAEQYEHVVRTKKAGDWKNWFTEEDVNYFRPHLAPYMQRYGYPDDWTLAAEPHINPEHGSEFVRRSVMIRRQQHPNTPAQALP
jgi:hypothetical protein